MLSINEAFHFYVPDPISHYPELIGNGKSGLQARDERLIVALKAYLQLTTTMPPVLRYSNGSINIVGTFALSFYKDFPDKDKWL